MIICTDAREAIELNSLLKSHKKKTLLAHSNMIFDEVHGIRADWAASVSGMYPILICTDDVLSDLNIQNVTWLIHHSVNLASKSRFYYRFSTLMDNWHAVILMHCFEQLLTFYLAPEPNFSSFLRTRTSAKYLYLWMTVMTCSFKDLWKLCKDFTPLCRQN